MIVSHILAVMLIGMAEESSIAIIEEEIRQIDRNYRSVRKWVIVGILCASLGILLLVGVWGSSNRFVSGSAIIVLSAVMIGYGVLKMSQFSKEKEALLSRIKKD